MRKARYVGVLFVVVVAVACGDDGAEPTTGAAAATTTSPATTSTPATTAASTSSTATSAAPTTTSVPSTTTTSVAPLPPLDVAQQWLAAYEAGDVGTFQGLMHADATSLCEGCGYDRATLPYFADGGGAFNDVIDSRTLALGNGVIQADCDDDGVTVVCAVSRTSAFDLAARSEDGQTTAQFTYEFTVDAGLITHYTLVFTGGNFFDFGQIQNYRLWLEDAHPAEAEELFAFTTILLSSDEQFELHKQFFAEYLASQ